MFRSSPQRLDDEPPPWTATFVTDSIQGTTVPVTARLSKKFYETFGEDVTNELVDWFNAVDATYRADLRELNELNFARFDAKLEQRLAQLDAQWRIRWAELDGKVAALGDTLRKELAQSLGELKNDLLKWLLGFWISTLLGLGALFFRG